MLLDFKEIGTAAMVLFAVIDIIGSIPIILDLRQKTGHIQSEKASLVALGIMICFLFVGESILKLIGISVNDLPLRAPSCCSFWRWKWCWAFKFLSPM